MTSHRRQQSSLGTTVYDKLKDLIASSEIPPGSRLRESDLADRMKVSRTPVREALKRLESEGLLVYVAQALTVARIDHQAVIELYAMREVLEGTAARFAARHASEAEIHELAEIINTNTGEQPDWVMESRLNKAFHSALYQASHNRYLLRSLQSISDALVLLGGTTLAMPNRIESSRDEHMAIVSAIEKRKPDEAEAAAREHIRNAQRERLKLLRERELNS